MLNFLLVIKGLLKNDDAQGRREGKPNRHTDIEYWGNEISNNATRQSSTLRFVVISFRVC